MTNYNEKLDDILDQVIRSAMMTSHIYGKVKFDNAKDTQELITAANENSEVLLEAVRQKVYPRIEAMLVEKLNHSLSKGDVFMKIGGKTYEIQEVL